MWVKYTLMTNFYRKSDWYSVLYLCEKPFSYLEPSLELMKSIMLKLEHLCLLPAHHLDPRWKFWIKPSGRLAQKVHGLFHCYFILVSPRKRPPQPTQPCPKWKSICLAWGSQTTRNSPCLPEFPPGKAIDAGPETLHSFPVRIFLVPDIPVLSQKPLEM